MVLSNSKHWQRLLFEMLFGPWGSDLSQKRTQWELRKLREADSADFWEKRTCYWDIVRLEMLETDARRKEFEANTLWRKNEAKDEDAYSQCGSPGKHIPPDPKSQPRLPSHTFVTSHEILCSFSMFLTPNQWSSDMEISQTVHQSMPFHHGTACGPNQALTEQTILQCLVWSNHSTLK